MFIQDENTTVEICALQTAGVVVNQTFTVELVFSMVGSTAEGNLYNILTVWLLSSYSKHYVYMTFFFKLSQLVMTLRQLTPPLYSMIQSTEIVLTYSSSVMQ